MIAAVFAYPEQPFILAALFLAAWLVDRLSRGFGNAR